MSNSSTPYQYGPSTFSKWVLYWELDPEPPIHSQKTQISPSSSPSLRRLLCFGVLVYVRQPPKFVPRTCFVSKSCGKGPMRTIEKQRVWIWTINNKWKLYWSKQLFPSLSLQPTYVRTHVLSHLLTFLIIYVLTPLHTFLLIIMNCKICTKGTRSLTRFTKNK